MFTMQPIGVMQSPLQDKLLIPRQAMLAPSIEGWLGLAEHVADPRLTSGLAVGQSIWLIWLMHATAERGWKPTVRPPRLGGNQRVGVWATRATHRPNAMGLSRVTYQGLEYRDGALGIRLSGIDLLDGTPVLDIKPWLPWADGPPNSQTLDPANKQQETGADLQTPQEPVCEHFAIELPPIKPLRFSAEAEQWLEQQTEPQRWRQQIQELLQQAPKPAYQQDPERLYIARFAGIDLCWRVAEDHVYVAAPRVPKEASLAAKQQ